VATVFLWSYSPSGRIGQKNRVRRVATTPDPNQVPWEEHPVPEFYKKTTSEQRETRTAGRSRGRNPSRKRATPGALKLDVDVGLKLTGTSLVITPAQIGAALVALTALAAAAAWAASQPADRAAAYSGGPGPGTVQAAPAGRAVPTESYHRRGQGGQSPGVR
jgi:hypothetical protein